MNAYDMIALMMGYSFLGYKIIHVNLFESFVGKCEKHYNEVLTKNNGSYI